ncbi:MAG: hypothetical protein MUC97_17830, partial [Bernardetiaceae bacterium]|nr:hypothetical protein [Bernardetiaceae bacterium]
MPTFFRHWGSLGLALAITWGLGACQKNEEGALVPSVSTCPIPTLQGPPLPSLRGWLFDREVNFGPDSLVTAGRVIRKDTVVGLRGRLPLYGAFYSSLTRTTMRANPNPVFPEVLNRVERVGIYTPTTPGGVLPKQFPGVLATLFCPYRHSFKPEPRPAVLLNGFAVEYVSFGPGRP